MRRLDPRCALRLREAAAAAAAADDDDDASFTGLP